MNLVNVTAIPFNRDSGMLRSDRPEFIFMFPADARYLNHLGTLHAAVIFTLAEATSGEFLQRHFADLRQPIGAMVRRAETKYRRPTSGAIYSRAIASPEALAGLLDQVTRRGRASIAVDVEILDETPALIATAAFEWFASRAPNPPNP